MIRRIARLSTLMLLLSILAMAYVPAETSSFFLPASVAQAQTVGCNLAPNAAFEHLTGNNSLPIAG